MLRLYTEDCHIQDLLQLIIFMCWSDLIRESLKYCMSLTLRKSVTNGRGTDSGQRTNSTVYRVAAQLIRQY